MEEREISIIDLMFEILLHWRMLIIWIIGGAVLFGTLGYMYSDYAKKLQQTQMEALRKGELEKEYTEEEIWNVSYMLQYEKVYLESETYRERSPLMQLDSNHLSKAEATIIVIAEDWQRSCSIARIYKDIVKSGEMIDKVTEDVGMETLGVNELLYLDGVAIFNKDRTSTFNMSTEQDGDADTFRIAAVYDDEEKCRAMLESAIANINGKKSEVENALGAHEIVVANKSFGIVSDMEIANLQKTVLGDIAVMKKGVADVKSGLSDKELQYYELLRSGAVEAEKEPEVVLASNVSVKYVLLGAVIAALAYVFIILLQYAFNTKVRLTDNLQELYGIPQLGTIPAVTGHKKVSSAIDRWIESIRDRNKRQFTSEEALELASVAVRMAVGKEALQDVCLMGCGMKECSIEICRKIKDRLEEDGIHTAVLNNVLYDVQMLEELDRAKGVILVESAGSTLYNEITEELKLLKRQGIKVLGGILVG